MRDYSNSTTETFWTRNVRLVTFLVCMAVFLSACVFVGARVYDYFQPPEEALPAMREADLLALCSRTPSLRLRDFEAYEHESGGEWTIDGRTGKTLFLNVGERYSLTVMEEVQVGRIIYLVIEDRETDQTLDLLSRSADLADFFKR